MHPVAPDVTIIAELCVSGQGTALQSAHQAAPGVRLELERAVVPPAGAPVLFLWATGGGFDRFEAAMPDDPTVDSFELVEDAGDTRLYRVVVDPEETIDTATIDREVGASRLSAWSSADGLFYETRFPDAGTLQRYVDLLRQEGLEVSLMSVYPAGQEHRPEQYGLSDKQWVVLQRAMKLGYFGVPRETDLTELAEGLDISEQAASERLRRGLATLLVETIGKKDRDEATHASSREAARDDTWSGFANDE